MSENNIITDPPLPMTPVFAYVRDRIQINQAFRDEIQAELDHREAQGSITSNATLYFLAREIVHTTSFTFAIHGHPLVFAADLYDGKAGGISTAGPAGAAGGPGTTGTAGQAVWPPATGKPGGPGGRGTDGRAGNGAYPITVLAKEVRDLKLTATGSIGGAAGKGGTGGKGGNGAVKPKPAPDDPYDTKPPTAGGAGGTGGNGGRGGDGAPIVVHSLVRTGLTPTANGGAGGALGPAGAGGAGGGWEGSGGGDEPGPAGKAGTAGHPGAAGAAAAVTLTTPQADDWWKKVVELVPEAAWASYRVRVGEYLFRSYGPGALNNRVQARSELESALKLQPAHGRARQLLSHLDLGLSPIGVGYLHDLRPDFEMYEDFVTSYAPEKNHLFDVTLQLLLHILGTGDKVEVAEVQRQHAEGMLASVETDVVIAESEWEQSKAQLQFAKEQLKLATEKVDAIHEERRQQQMSVGDFFTTLGEVIGVIASVVSAVYTFGASLAATVSCVGLLVNDIGAIVDVSEIVDLKDPLSPKLTKKGEQLKGKLSDAIQGVKQFIDKAEALAELVDKPEDDEILRREKELVRQQIEAAFQVNMRGLDVEQAALAVISATQKRDAYKADVVALGSLASGWEDDMGQLSKVARTFLRQFQTYVDFFIEYGFRMARAYDIYTLPTKLEASAFRFDYGYIHPDIEENAFFALERGDDNRVIGLLGAYTASLNTFVPARLSSQYTVYDNKLSFGNWAWPVTNPTVIANLKSTGAATFAISMTGLPSLYTELKVVRAELALIGATTNGALWIPVWLEHLGSATNRRSDQTPISVTAPMRGESVPARTVPIDLEQLSEDEMQQFWGRSPITSWRVAILPEAAVNAGLDLSGLNQLQLAVRFKYVNPTAPVKKEKETTT
jgi:hypothetical protein